MFEVGKMNSKTEKHLLETGILYFSPIPNKAHFIQMDIKIVEIYDF